MNYFWVRYSLGIILLVLEIKSTLHYVIYNLYHIAPMIMIS